MNTKALVTPVILAVVALSVLAITVARAAQSVPPCDAAVITLYDVASARDIASSDVSFSSISAAASSRIEAWARQNGISAPDEMYGRHGWTATYGDKSYDCFKPPKGSTYNVVCVRDDGEFLGASAVPKLHS